jgi:hypothetical protein
VTWRCPRVQIARLRDPGAHGAQGRVEDATRPPFEGASRRGARLRDAGSHGTAADAARLPLDGSTTRIAPLRDPGAHSATAPNRSAAADAPVHGAKAKPAHAGAGV